MSELRWDPLKDNWTIMTLGQSRRPQDFWQPPPAKPTAACPFCYGNESRTPAEIYAYRPEGSAPNQPGWQVRVIPNRFPALGIEGERDSRAVGLYDCMNGIGAHEVIIETPDHNSSMAELPVAQLTEVLMAYRLRMLDLRKDTRLRYIFIFKNYRFGPTVQIPHPHSQLIAVPMVPPLVKAELKNCKEHFLRKERCLVCDLLAQERQDGQRVITEDGHFLVYTPYASSLPFELMIAPLEHSHDFARQSDDQLKRLAAVLHDTLQRLRAALRNPAYSLTLHSAPPQHRRWGQAADGDSPEDHYHWHIEVAPKLIRSAGFEWGSGIHINPIAPEEAADFLRRAGRQDD